MLQDPLLSSPREKSHSSHSFWILWGVWPRAQKPSEDCSFSVRIVRLPDCVAMETKLFYALKSKYFLWPHALLTPWSKLGSTQGIRTIQTHNFLFFSLALETIVFLRLWEDKKLGGWEWGARHYLYSHFSKSHSNEWLYLWPRVTGNFRCSYKNIKEWRTLPEMVTKRKWYRKK